MTRVFYAAARALKSLPTSALFRILLLSMLFNAFILISLIVGVYFLFAQFTLFGEFDWLADFGITALSTIIAYFIYPIILPLIISFFDTAIAEAIETNEYPELPSVEPPFWPTIAQDIRFALKAILLNIVVLPLYLLPGLNLVLYYLLNGYLLGNEFFNVVAGRHIERKEAEQLKSRYGFTVVLAGCMITISSTIPFLNLIAPIFGVALMVHFFHALKPKYKILLKTDAA